MHTKLLRRLFRGPTSVCKDFGRTNYSENFDAIFRASLKTAHLVLVMSVRKFGEVSYKRDIYVLVS
jgi:hypothetical protein